MSCLRVENIMTHGSTGGMNLRKRKLPKDSTMQNHLEDHWWVFDEVSGRYTDPITGMCHQLGKAWDIQIHRRGIFFSPKIYTDFIRINMTIARKTSILRCRDCFGNGCATCFDSGYVYQYEEKKP